MLYIDLLIHKLPTSCCSTPRVLLCNDSPFNKLHSHPCQTQIASGELGSPANEQLLHALRPAYWFAAHLHTKFPALVPHEEEPPTPSGAAPAGDGGGSCGASSAAAAAAAAAGGLGGSVGGVGAVRSGNGAHASGSGTGAHASGSGTSVHAGGSGREDGNGGGRGKGHPATRFLALDKCLPGRDFLQVCVCVGGGMGGGMGVGEGVGVCVGAGW